MYWTCLAEFHAAGGQPLGQQGVDGGCCGVNSKGTPPGLLLACDLLAKKSDQKPPVPVVSDLRYRPAT